MTAILELSMQTSSSELLSCALTTRVMLVHFSNLARRFTALISRIMGTLVRGVLRLHGHESFQLVRSAINDAPHGSNAATDRKS